MLTNLPFQGPSTILKPFGGPADTQSGLPCGEGAPRAHPGIDFSLPVGSSVAAVAPGSVLIASDDPTTGRSLLIGHPWGQTYYANLASLAVGRGVSVSAGQPIATSGPGPDGGEEGAHLHFGIRIRPHSVEDGWCGFSDPQYYLDRIDVPAGAIIGPHILGGVHRHLPTLKTWQPRIILVVDPNPDEMALLREACPRTRIIGRIYVPDGEVSDRIRRSPTDAAQWANELVLKRQSPNVDYWQIANEVLSQKGDLPLLNQFELARMALAEAAGYRCALFGFAVGNPDLPEADRLADWRLLYPAIERAEAQGHIVAVHQYGSPDLVHPTVGWHVHRLERQLLRRLPYKRVQFAVTEFGIDGLLTGSTPKGWKGQLSAADYVQQLLRAGAYAERFSARVLGYAVYSLGVTGPWATYDIDGEVAAMLAEESDRGTWKEVNSDDGGIDDLEVDDNEATDGDSQTPTQPTQPTEPSVPTEPSGPGEPTEPGEPAGPTQPTAPAIERRVSDWATHYNLNIRTAEERPDHPESDGTVYRLKDLFTTANGSWEVTNREGSLPQWARDAYLKREFLEAGADHHLFAAVLGEDGKLIPGKEIRYWSDGFDKLGDPSYNGYIEEETKGQSGWANLVVFSGSSYAPERGESGPWCWTPSGRSDVIVGGGMPANHHVSVFAVWQAVKESDVETLPETPPTGQPSQPTAPTPVQPPVQPPSHRSEPPTEGPSTHPTTVTPSSVPLRIGTWIPYLRLSTKGIDERPDKPTGDVVYVVKDIFTTRDGSWDPSSNMGSVDSWARESYLKPWGADDYFDDAGADHHVFGAVFGLDGALLRDFEILFWSDGFSQLGNPDYTGYVSRLTKTKSGWANIPMYSGASYSPDRGEQGPWCWAPKGASEVAVGAGMPLNNHVSFFVVWQAVKSVPVVSPGDNHIFLPWVGTPGAAPSQELPLPPGAGLPGVQQPPPRPGGPPGLLPPPIEDPGLSFLRADAWLRVGVESAPDSAMASYARRVGLGMPVTHEFTSRGYVAQGFAGAIVFAPLDNLEEIHHLTW